MRIRGKMKVQLNYDTEKRKSLTVILGEIRCPKCHRSGRIEMDLNAEANILLRIKVVHRGIKYYEDRDLVKLCYFKADCDEFFSGISALRVLPEIKETSVGA